MVRSSSRANNDISDLRGAKGGLPQALATSDDPGVRDQTIAMPTLISEIDVRLERNDLLRRIALPREVDASGMIVPPKRTPGLHLSGLLKYIAHKSKITAYITDADEEDAIERGHLPLRWFLGQIVEEGLVSLYPGMFWQPGETNDPLIMTCDGITPGVEEDADNSLPYCLIEEFKCKRAKRMDGAKFVNKWIFMQQGLGYCLGYGGQHVRWHILALFEWPDPVYTQYLVKFEQKELDDCRRMIDRNRDAAIENGYAE